MAALNGVVSARMAQVQTKAMPLRSKSSESTISWADKTLATAKSKVVTMLSHTVQVAYTQVGNPVLFSQEVRKNH